jgi:hypothetical protein
VTASDAPDDVAGNLGTDSLLAPLGRLPVQERPSPAELVTVVELVRNHRAVLVNVGYGRAPPIHRQRGRVHRALAGNGRPDRSGRVVALSCGLLVATGVPTDGRST